MEPYTVLEHLPAAFPLDLHLVWFFFPFIFLFIFKVHFTLLFFKIVPLQALNSLSITPNKLLCGYPQAHVCKSVLSFLSPGCLVCHWHDFYSLHFKRKIKTKTKQTKTKTQNKTVSPPPPPTNSNFQTPRSLLTKETDT